eukprot:TRINITY_DN5897_c0_g4_i1.p1 TRINITY_DN5897_c0_g4~~TRINITY_DN5897_c0_g4_i1.p1  ORF type:complete len:282 (-),score=90.36 TRINITY_DN5897_c0_g4_i1:238-1083(-)
MANGVTTEWDDLHRKMGNFAPLPNTKEIEAEREKHFLETAENFDPLANKKLEELEEYEDDLDDEIFEKYKQARLNEMKEKAARPYFGSLREISKQDYVQEVTNAPKDVWVVLHLYQDYYDKCTLINNALDTLAKSHTYVKFLRIIATRCIENFPDSKIPTFIVYKNGSLVYNWANVDKEIKRCDAKILELFLKYHRILDRTDEDPDDEDLINYKEFITKIDPKRESKKYDDRSDSDEDDREYSNLRVKKFQAHAREREERERFRVQCIILLVTSLCFVFFV